MKRRILSLFLAICLVASVVPAMTFSASAATENDVESWMNNQINKAIDYDGAYGVQCVDFFNYYLKNFWGISNPISLYPVSYAYQIFDRDAPSGWQKIAGNSDFRVGDIVIWNKGNGSTTGHVGLVYSVNGGVKIIQERYSGHLYVTVNDIHWTSLIRGVFRPPLETAVSAPAPSNAQTVTPGKYTLKNVGSGYTMNYACGWTGLSYKPIIMSNADGSPEQTFDLQYNGDGQYTIAITHSDGGVLNIWRDSGAAQAGDAVTKLAGSGSALQKFYLTPVGGGNYILQSASDYSKVIAAPTADYHAMLQMENYSASDNKQLWTLTPVSVPATSPFTDVQDSGSYYYKSVLWAAEKSVTTGVTATTFSPDGLCSRAQVVTFLWRALGSPAPSSTYNPFTDVASGTYYYKAVLWATQNGITNGTSGTTFSPDETVTRAQFVTLLWRRDGEKSVSGSNPFTDLGNSGNYYYTAVQWAASNGITSGTATTTFSPFDSCSRGQVVTFLYRYLGA